MTSPDQLISKPCPRESLEIRKAELPSPALNLFWFMALGLPFLWYSRLKWSYADWEKYFAENDVHTYIGYDQGTPFGYYELELKEQDLEISFFGLLPEFTGRGLGGWFLSRTVEDAWALNPRRVWVHTCTEDHPVALQNYLSRGFVEFDRVTEMEALPSLDNPHTFAQNFWRSYVERFSKS